MCNDALKDLIEVEFVQLLFIESNLFSPVFAAPDKHMGSTEATPHLIPAQ